MDTRKKPYWPRPGHPSSRFLELVERGIVLDSIWKGQHASYRYRDRELNTRVGSWVYIKKLWY